MSRVTDKKFELRAKTYSYGLKYPMKASDNIREIREAYVRFICKGYFDIRLLVDGILTDLSYLDY